MQWYWDKHQTKILILRLERCQFNWHFSVICPKMLKCEIVANPSNEHGSNIAKLLSHRYPMRKESVSRTAKLYPFCNHYHLRSMILLLTLSQDQLQQCILWSWSMNISECESKDDQMKQHHGINVFGFNKMTIVGNIVNK